MLILFKYYIKKIIALLSSVRIYNLFQLGVSIYLSAIFLFNTKENYFTTLTSPELHYLALASLLTIAAGYIINNFYDQEKDELIKPIQTHFQSQVEQKYKLYLYLFFNSLALLLAYFSSWRVFIFFFLYQFFLWFYSHKLNKILFINNISYALLSIAPFLALVFYYHSWHHKIYAFGMLLFILLIILDVIKDLISHGIDQALGYSSIPTVYGKREAKIYISTLNLLGIFILGTLIYFLPTSLFHFYMVFVIFSLILVSIILFSTSKTENYQILKVFYRFLIFLGIFFIAGNKIIS